MSNKAKDQKSRERRKRVVTRLETQLKYGWKTTPTGEEQLTSKDETRIKKELAVLAGRV